MKQPEFVSQLKKLVEIKSVSENRSENKRLVSLVSSIANKKAVIQKWSSKESDILILSNKKTMEPDIAYLAHGDVVSADNKLFKLVKKGDKISGRGVFDMKFSIPIGVELLNEFIKTNKKSSFCFVLTTDEEVGGFNGAKILAQKYKFNPKVLIVPDGGDNFEFCYKSKGVIHVLVSANGRAAHASEPWLGESAIEKLIAFAEILRKKYSKNNNKASWNTTCNFGQIKGGESTNQVCDCAEMRLDFRFPEKFKPNDILNELKNIAKKNKIDLEISELVSGEATFTDPKNPIVKKFVAVFENILKRKVKFSADYGASDARFFQNCPVLMIKPVGGGIHANNEWVSLKSCLKFEEAMKNFLGEYK